MALSLGGWWSLWVVSGVWGWLGGVVGEFGGVVGVVRDPTTVCDFPTLRVVSGGKG